MNLLLKTIEKLYFKIPGNLAMYDAHTKLHNRNWWEMVGKKKYNSTVVYVTMIDVDNLKEINDKCGHEVGDRLIEKVAGKIRLLFPNGDCVRLGGDEFLVLTAENPCEKLIVLNDECCFGCYKKKEKETIKQACKIADKKMYRMKNIKKAGRSA